MKIGREKCLCLIYEDVARENKLKCIIEEDLFIDDSLIQK